MKKTLIITLIVIVLIVILAITGFVVYKNLTKPHLPGELNPSLDNINGVQTADWITYVNKSDGFTIKYPPELKVTEIGSNTGYSIFLGKNVNNYILQIEKVGSVISFANNQQRKTTFNEDVSNFEKNYLSQQSYKQENISIAGKESIKFSFTNKFGNFLIYILIPTETKDGAGYFLISSGPNIIKNDETQLDQIVSTFKFTK